MFDIKIDVAWTASITLFIPVIVVSFDEDFFKKEINSENKIKLKPFFKFKYKPVLI